METFFSFGNLSFDVHFMLDQTGVLFLGHQVYFNFVSTRLLLVMFQLWDKSSLQYKVEKIMLHSIDRQALLRHKLFLQRYLL